MKIDIPKALEVLAKRRPVFHLEADFRLELILYLNEMYSEFHAISEYPIQRNSKEAYDIMLLQNNKEVMAIELKYFGENINYEINGEIFNLKNRNAHNDNSYKSFENVKRMEGFLKKNPSAAASVIILTNNYRYWSGPQNKTADYAPFALTDGRAVSGHLDWVNKPKEKMSAIYLHGNYVLKWGEYSEIHSNNNYGRFRYLHIPIQLPEV